MAKTAVEPRQVHRIERVSAASTQLCHTCKRVLDEGTWQLVEAFVRDDGKWARSHASARTRPRGDSFDDNGHAHRESLAVRADVGTRSHHLDCAAAHAPFVLRSALTGASALPPEKREALERQIELALAVVDTAEEQADTRDDYWRFVNELREHAEPNEQLEEVFADWLQSVGDPRGELASIQRALVHANALESDRLHGLERKLIAAHRPRFVPDRFEGELTWRSGFVHRLDLVTNQSFDRLTLARAFAHPSFRLLRELSSAKTDRWVSIVQLANMPTLPATLRVLELGHPEQRPGLGDVSAALVGLPRLERLVLNAACDLGLAHESLRSLELRCVEAHALTTTGAPPPAFPALDWQGRPVTRPENYQPPLQQAFVNRIDDLAWARLPKVTHFTLRVSRGLDAVLTRLALHWPGAAVKTLVLEGDLSAEGVRALEQLTGLETLDVRGCASSPAELASLSKVAPTLVTSAAEAVSVVKEATPLKEWKVRHTRRPEWGIGTVVGEGDAGLEIDFAGVGRKQVRNVELLEDVSG